MLAARVEHDGGLWRRVSHHLLQHPVQVALLGRFGEHLAQFLRFVQRGCQHVDVDADVDEAADFGLVG
jgi:hypothetical protein